MIEDFYTEAQVELQDRRAAIRVRAARFREAAAEAHTSWRLGCVASRRNWRPEEEVFRSGVSEIVALRLVAAYNPLFRTLQRIENQLAILAAVREDPYAPPRR